MAYTKALNVFTEKDYRAFRTEDLMQIHDRNTIFYDKHSDDEVIYSLQQGSGIATFLFTNKGYYGGVGLWGYVGHGVRKFWKIRFPPLTLEAASLHNKYMEGAKEWYFGMKRNGLSIGLMTVLRFLGI